MADTVLHTRFAIFAIDSERDPKIFKGLTGDRYAPLEFSLAVIRAFVSPDSTIVDAGAHIGTFAVPLSKSVKRIVAFEPSPSTFAYLAKNVGLNRAANIEIHNEGLAAARGHASLEPIPDGLATSQTLDVNKGGTIRVVALDDEVQKADFIKMDVEGMELQALKGATQLMRRSKPGIFFEVNTSALRQQGTSASDLQRFFTEQGYALWYPFEYRGRLCAGRIWHILMSVVLISPSSVFCGRKAFNFDLLAMPKGRPLPASIEAWSSVRMAFHLIALNIRDKAGRIRKRIPLCSKP